MVLLVDVIGGCGMVGGADPNTDSQQGHSFSNLCLSSSRQFLQAESYIHCALHETLLGLPENRR